MRRVGEVKVNARGQVTIPLAIRQQAGMLPGTKVEIVLDEGGGVRLLRIDSPARATRGARAVDALRRGRGHVAMSTDDVMALTRGWS